MDKIICGELEYNSKKYYFNFRNNILVIQPEKMEYYPKWCFNNSGNESSLDEGINVEGETNEGRYICFVNVKFSQIGRGILQSFVPTYVLGKANAVSPLPKCIDIEKISFEGKSLDKFCYPKRIIKHDNLCEEKPLKIEIDYNQFKNRKFTIDKDVFSYDIRWTMPISSDINNVLNVKTILSVTFSKPKNINDIIDYYRNIEKFFCFINNRRIVRFSDIKLKKKEPVRFEIENEIKDMEFQFTLHITEPREEIDILDDLNCIRLDDVTQKYKKLYKCIVDKDFLVHYYPLNKREDSYVDNDKYTQVSSAFESEFRKLFPDFKSTINEEYKIVKSGLLRYISNKKSRIKKKQTELNKKQVRKELKYCEYFANVLSNIDGNLEEKITYSFDRYKQILEKKRIHLLNAYNIKKVKNTVLSKSFANRRNKISHGKSTGNFNDLEIISYILLRICIYCITLERCKFSFDEIEKMVNKIF